MGALRLGSALLLLAACAQPRTQAVEMERRADQAPAELAILPIELHSGDAAALDLFREAVAQAAVDEGFTALARPFVDQAGIDLDVPALDDAGVLRIRLRDWVEQTEPSVRLRGEIHGTLYLRGEVLFDGLLPFAAAPDAAEASADPSQRLAGLRRRCARELVALLPPPPSIATL